MILAEECKEACPSKFAKSIRYENSPSDYYWDKKIYPRLNTLLSAIEGDFLELKIKEVKEGLQLFVTNKEELEPNNIFGFDFRVSVVLDKNGMYLHNKRNKVEFKCIFLLKYYLLFLIESAKKYRKRDESN